MSFDAIKQEISTWDVEQLSRLITLANAMRISRDPEFRSMLDRKIDQPREGWMTSEEAARRVGVQSEPAS
jgi:hypothetical protein